VLVRRSHQPLPVSCRFHVPQSVQLCMVDDNTSVTLHAAAFGLAWLGNGAGNDPPVAASDIVSVSRNGSVVISPLDNDQDANGDDLTVANVSGLSPNIGTLTMAGDGQSLSYAAPASAANGTVVTFTYNAFDGTDYSNVATVTITVGKGMHAHVQGAVERAQRVPLGPP
jgi:Bacterial Ig domain